MLTDASHLSILAMHPSRSPAYSPNLHRWLRMQQRRGLDRTIHDQVFRVTAGSLLCRRYSFAPGELMIGCAYENQPFADDFSGAQLMHVLTMGSQAIRMCYPGGMGGLERIDDFWERYHAIGRCAIDPEHDVHFIDDANRFEVRGDTRVCRWCGAKQHQAHRTVQVDIEIWEAA